MKKTINHFRPAFIATVVGLLLIGYAVAVPMLHPVDAHGDVDPVRGGLLYDKWWAASETGEAHEHAGGEEQEHTHDEDANAPEGDHPLWSTQDSNTLTGPDTWRCKECHGWDYKGADGAYGSGSHYTGFPGILDSTGKPTEVIMAVLRGSTNPDHDFSEVIGEEDLENLAAFISEALVDTDTLLDDDHNSAGDATNGAELFAMVCTNCHGPAGNAINFGGLAEPEFLGNLAGNNPWEFIHKVRFGQPGWPMPSAIRNGWTEQDVADVLAYAETLTTEAALSGGGPLYDKWWAAISVDAPAGDHPLWETQDTSTLTGEDTWRCKECHGWDYRGADGAYGTGSHFTGFPGVLDAASASEGELLSWLDGTANPDHDFSPYLDDVALNALVAFLQQETTDISDYVNDDGSVNGDPRLGRDLFGGTCAACHGTDGQAMNFGSMGEPEFVGTVAAENPWEFFHKASFGHPGVPMPAARALGWTEQDIADVLAYAQTLPR